MLLSARIISPSTVDRRLQVSSLKGIMHLDTDHQTDGFTREVYLINGQQPGPSIEIDEGDELEVFVKNELAVESTIHWHGEEPEVQRSKTSQKDLG